MSGLQAATNNGGHDGKVDEPGEDLPCCGISMSAEGPWDKKKAWGGWIPRSIQPQHMCEGDSAQE